MLQADEVEVWIPALLWKLAAALAEPEISQVSRVFCCSWMDLDY